MNYVILLAILEIAFGWQTVGPGIEYHHERLKDPNDAFILRVSRKHNEPIIDTMTAHERVKGARERTTSMFERYSDSLTSFKSKSFDGERFKAIAAVNGYYFHMGTGKWISGGISNGWYLHRFTDLHKQHGFGSGYGFRYDRSVFVGECVHHSSKLNKIVLSSKKSEYSISGINVDRGRDHLILYTPQYDTTTSAAIGGVEIVVKLAHPLGIMPGTEKFTGKIVEIRPGRSKAVLLFDTVVLAADGTTGDKLKKEAVLGETVEFYQHLEHTDEATCSHKINYMNIFFLLVIIIIYHKICINNIYKII